MTRTVVVQTNFTGGEIDPQLMGRVDAQAYRDGCKRLSNVLIDPKGGVRRRPGTKWLAALAGPARLAAYEIDVDLVRLFIISAGQITIVDNDDFASAVTIGSFWQADDLGQLSWTQYEAGLMVSHPDYQTAIIEQHVSTGQWFLRDLLFDDQTVDGVGYSRRPFGHFAPANCTMTVTAAPTYGADKWQLATSHAVFKSNHPGTLFRVQGIEFRVVTYLGSTTVIAEARQSTGAIAATTDWDEQAFSEVRGYPIAATFFQKRLVLAGPREASNYLWFSKIGEPFNFDLGAGLDDEAIAFQLRADRTQAIRALMPSRDLQVFTTSSEWAIVGTPLTPQSVRTELQTRIGSRSTTQVPPLDVDGATIFVGRSGKDLREFIYTDAEAAYRASDLALLSAHLLRDPIDQAFSQTDRVLYILNEDGTIAAATIERTSGVVAWSELVPNGRVLALASVGAKLYAVVERDGATGVERFDAEETLDGTLHLSAPSQQNVWSGLERFDGRSVRVIADGEDKGAVAVSSGTLALSEPARDVAVGFAFAHEIQPLDYSLSGRGGMARHRPVRHVFQLHETDVLWVEPSPGASPIKLTGGSGEPVTGRLEMRAAGWIAPGQSGGWRIRQDDPAKFALLSVTTELKVNN
ncbi:MAG: hypothetical protein ACFB6S_06575 [Geminicoccaceae bacterium]